MFMGGGARCRVESLPERTIGIEFVRDRTIAGQPDTLISNLYVLLCRSVSVSVCVQSFKTVSFR